MTWVIRALSRRSCQNYYRVLFSDPGGNDERYTFLYDSRFIAPLEEVGRGHDPA